MPRAAYAKGCLCQGLPMPRAAYAKGCLCQGLPMPRAAYAKGCLCQGLSIYHWLPESMAACLSLDSIDRSVGNGKLEADHLKLDFNVSQ